MKSNQSGELMDKDLGEREKISKRKTRVRRKVAQPKWVK